VFLTGSDMDEWIPEERTQQTAQVLADLGAEVEMRVYPSRPHLVSDLELSEARSFLASTVPAGQV
jgi:predicted esterase